MTRPYNRILPINHKERSQSGRKGKLKSPWRFGIPRCKGKPPRPEWVK